MQCRSLPIGTVIAFEWEASPDKWQPRIGILEGVRDLEECPLTSEDIEKRPNMERSRWQYFIHDLARQERRAFYGCTMRGLRVVDLKPLQLLAESMMENPKDFAIVFDPLNEPPEDQHCEWEEFEDERSRSDITLYAVMTHDEELLKVTDCYDSAVCAAHQHNDKDVCNPARVITGTVNGLKLEDGTLVALHDAEEEVTA